VTARRRDLDVFLDRAAERHLAELVELASFASVSGDPAYARDVLSCAEWLERHLTRIGLDDVRTVATGGNPVVAGEWLGLADAPTVLVYGHYDVQPPDPLDAWTSPPFAPTVRNGRLYGRGVSDSKGQILGALAAIEALLTVGGALPCNVRVLIEGEEEKGADNLEALLLARRGTAMLDADVALVTDSGMLAEDVPGLPVGLRGMVAAEITLRTAGTDLHSGLYGGIAPNAVVELARLLAGLKDPETGRVLVEGFYDGIQAVPEEELAAWDRLPFDEQDVARAIGARRLSGEDGFSWYERMWARPTLDVCGIWGGYTGEGVKTVIPAEAHAKLSCRVVPGQDPAAVLAALCSHLTARAAAGTDVSIDSTLVGAPGVVLPTDHAGVRAALGALEEGFGKRPSLFRAGYSVPVVDLFARHLGLQSVMLGFMLPDENMHAPDEFIRLDVFRKGIRTYAGFLERLGAGQAPAGGER
jgi:acetylornithine deacetylase/succinyl-diaminopimelate desuccinylase-like protein